MSIFGAANASTVNQRVRQAASPAREADRRKPTTAAPGAVRGEDELDLELSGSASDGAVRSLKGNGDQETAEDRAQQDGYQAPPMAPKKPERPALDIKG